MSLVRHSGQDGYKKGLRPAASVCYTRKQRKLHIAYIGPHRCTRKQYEALLAHGGCSGGQGTIL